MSSRALIWTGFHAVVFAILALDLGLFRRQPRVVTPKQGALWTLAWVTLSLAFAGGIWSVAGSKPAMEFLTGYTIEYALSVDNLFVFLLVFSYFKVAPELRHSILFWGILGAFAMRASLILLGTALVARFHLLLYLFGAFLVFTAIKMLVSSEEDEVDPSHNRVFLLARRYLPISDDPEGTRFFVRRSGRWFATPLFLVLLVVEATDLLFAVDSIPAVLGVSRDPFIVYSSNVCAILGLRSLFFVVASLMDSLHYLKFGLAAVLGLVGAKMLLSSLWQPPVLASLVVIAAILGVAMLASWLWPPGDTQPESEPESSLGSGEPKGP